MTDAPGTVRRWVLAARPRTLPAAAVPVAIAIASVRPATINWANSVLCVVVALALQIGVNYANDYSDGIRGTDEVRVGPFRLTASRLVPAATVKRAAFLCFAAAGVSGLILASRVSWWFVPIGVSAVLAAWFYTGGPKPYGYMGLGELFVLIYFGFVATVGTNYAQGHGFSGRAWWLGLATGAMAVALLEANNARDIDGDRLAGKHTIAARLGRTGAGWLYVASVFVAVASLASAHVVIAAVVALVLYGPAVRVARSEASGRDLLVLLRYSARAQLVVGVVAMALLALRVN